MAHRLGGAGTLTTTDGGRTYRLVVNSILTASPGDYELQLIAQGAGVADLFGNPLEVGAGVSWTQLASAPWPGGAEPFLAPRRITPSNPFERSEFGRSVAASAQGDVLLAVGHSVLEPTSKAFVWRRDGDHFTEFSLAAVQDDRLSSRSGYGGSLAMSSDGGVLAIGRTRFSGDGIPFSGAVHVYRWDGDDYVESILTASDGRVAGLFGSALDVSGDGRTIVVGTRKGLGSLAEPDSVYVYRWDEDRQTYDESKLDVVGTASLGYGVAVSDDGRTIVASDPYDSVVGQYSGAAFVFFWDGEKYQLGSFLYPPGGAADDRFGESIDLSADGETIVVGAPYSDVWGNVDNGAAYLYRWDGARFREVQLTAFDGETRDRFGTAVSISGDGGLVLVGASAASFRGGSWTSRRAGAYVYQWDGLRYLESKLPNPGADAADYLAFEVAASDDGRTLLVSSPGLSIATQDGSGVFVYQAETIPPTAAFMPVDPNPRQTGVETIEIQFSEPVREFDVDDLVLDKSFDGVGNLIPASAKLSSDDGRTYTLSGLYGATLDEGDYRLAFADDAAVLDLAGNALVAEAVLSWTNSGGGTWPGDVDGDRDVDLADFNLLKAHFNTSHGPDEGDLNRDGKIDLADFSLLKAHFNTSDAAFGAAILAALAEEEI